MKNSFLSSLQIDVERTLAEEIRDWGKKHLSDEDLVYSDTIFGREDDIHITIIYGVHSSVTTTTNIFKKEKSFDVTLKDITVFDNDKYDVLKIDIESDKLHRIYRIANNDLIHIPQRPMFVPHITIAYLKKDTGVLSNLDRRAFYDRTFDVSSLTFNPPFADKVTIELLK